MLTNGRGLLALCGVADAIISAIHFFMYETGPTGPLSFAAFQDAAILASRLALLAGVCTVAAGIWRSAKGNSWLLILNGLAFSAYGLIPLVYRGPLSFDSLALLLVAMAAAFGILALAIARSLRRSVADQLFFGLAGGGSIGFALAVLALASGWIQLERRAFHPSLFLWLCLYFAFSAVCMLGLATRLRLARVSMDNH
jgi:hypothetical protein